MVKVGLLADIHADPDALRDGLRLLKSHGVSRVLCAGDLVDKGPGGDAVIEMMRARDIPCVAGNHDRDAAKIQRWYTENVDPIELMLEGRLLTQSTLDFLEKLPPRLVIQVEQSKVLLAHGTPWSDTLYLFPGGSTNIFRRVAHETRSAGAQTVILGHTHVPMEGQIDGVRILNPGSVCGRFASGTRTVGVLTLPSGGFEVLEIDSGQAVRPARPVSEYLDGAS